LDKEVFCKAALKMFPPKDYKFNDIFTKAKSNKLFFRIKNIGILLILKTRQKQTLKYLGSFPYIS